MSFVTLILVDIPFFYGNSLLCDLDYPHDDMNQCSFPIFLPRVSPKFFKTYADTERGISTTPTHLHLQYWESVQHCLSIFRRRSNKKLLAFFKLKSFIHA